MKTRYLVILNPAAGCGTAAKSLPTITRGMHRHGLAHELVQTERRWHAAQLAEAAVSDGVDVVVAAGGDGTANEVLNGLMAARERLDRSAAMGVLCVGRGNDFAYGAGVPREVESGCRVLAEDHRRAIDVGRALGGDWPAGRYFGNGVGIGFDAVVGFEAAKMRHLRGFASYLVATLRTILLYYDAPAVRIVADGGVTETSALMISIMNGRRLGGGFLMAPQAMTDDGLFDLCIAHQMPRRHMLAVVPRFTKGTQASDPRIETGRAARLVVTAISGSLPAHADGETLCVAGREITVELIPRAVEVVCQVSP